MKEDLYKFSSHRDHSELFWIPLAQVASCCYTSRLHFCHWLVQPRTYGYWGITSLICMECLDLVYLWSTNNSYWSSIKIKMHKCTKLPPSCKIVMMLTKENCCDGWYFCLVSVIHSQFCYSYIFIFCVLPQISDFQTQIIQWMKFIKFVLTSALGMHLCGCMHTNLDQKLESLYWNIKWIMT